MNNIISYLTTVYHPLAIITYGSYANGTNNQNSDYDALLIVSDGEKQHDCSVVDGIVLDIFIYPLSQVIGEINIEDFIQIFDGKIILDTDGAGQNLKDRVLRFMETRPCKTREEVAEEIQWCKKMLSRVQRGDAEGYFRWHWLLIDSLEIACDIFRQPYYGPKKSLKWLKAEHPDLFALYSTALKEFDEEALEEWVTCLCKCFPVD
ncbi:MAG: nucleotidyltransferase domain-containing protein [Clostridiales bacterium]|nr:nucleotidyltransferase domain-containing protein [Clostridiales bacterium]